MEHIDQRIQTASSRKETKYVIRVSHDKMSAYMSVYPAYSEPVSISPIDLKQKLIQYGVVFGVKFQVLSELSGRLSQSGDTFENICVAAGKPSNDGQDARIELVVETIRHAIGKTKEDGGIDYKQKETIIKVKEHQIIAYYHAPTSGVDGQQVDGSLIRAKHGKRLHLNTENVHFDEENKTYSAAIDGQLIFRKNLLAVHGIRIIDHDVDFETGCVDFPGTVWIGGSVIPEFYVKARGDVTIGDSITDALVECGGHLKIRGGIVGANKSKVKTGGSIYAGYIQNSTVISNESITVRKAVYGSRVFARDKIIVEDAIIGGVVSAGKEIIARDVGSATGTTTFLEVGLQPEVRKQANEISEKIHFCEQNIEKIRSSLGDNICNLPREMLNIIRQGSSEELNKLLDMLDHLNAQKQALITEQEELLDNSSRGLAAFIKVKGTIHSGTRISIKGKKIVLEQMHKYTKFYYDDNQRIIRWVSL